MIRLKLTKSISYCGHGVTVSAANPFVEVTDKSLAEKLAASGYFMIVSEAPGQEAPTEKKPSAKNPKKE